MSSTRDKLFKAFKAVVPNHIPINDLFSAYDKENRIYHNTKHLWNMLTIGTDEVVIPEGVDPFIFFAAVGGHDFVQNYISSPGDNEFLSACRTVSFFELNQSQALYVGHMIQATSRHHMFNYEWASWQAQELLDRDLFSFSQPYELFMEDSLNVVKEIFLCAGEACRPKTKKQIIDSQKEFYQHLISSRPTIYYRHTEWESAARQNLARYCREVEVGE